MENNQFNYGYWRTDKEKEPGFSHELISSDSQCILDLGGSLDDFNIVPENGCDTLYK
jgi:hypothetical protein